MISRFILCVWVFCQCLFTYTMCTCAEKGNGFPELEWAIIWIHEIKSSPLRNKVLFTVDQFLQACIKLLIGKDLLLILCQLFSICLAVLLFLPVLFLSPLKKVLWSGSISFFFISTIARIWGKCGYHVIYIKHCGIIIHIYWFSFMFTDS